jgi:hypothetical protein
MAQLLIILVLFALGIGARYGVREWQSQYAAAVTAAVGDF